MIDLYVGTHCVTQWYQKLKMSLQLIVLKWLALFLI
jgi:hypothetical protein